MATEIFSEMNPVEREPLVQSLSSGIDAYLVEHSEVEGVTLLDQLSEELEAPKSNVHFALGRIPLTFLPGGVVKKRD